MGTWVKLTSKSIYLMQGDAPNQFLEQVDLTAKATPDEFDLVIPKGWFTGEKYPIPGTMSIDLDISDPEPAPFPKATANQLRVRAPSGVVFDVIDSQKSNDSRLKEFQPNRELSSDIKLPRFYFAINSAAEFSKPLTEHFMLAEFISDTEMTQGMDFPYFIPVALIRLAEAIEALRAKLKNKPIKVSSGYRSPFYPDYVSKPNFLSTHRFGTAVDFTVAGDLLIDTDADLDFVYSAAFDKSLIPSPSSRPSGKSSFGFEFAESSAEMPGGIVDHAHLDMGFISQGPELAHLGGLLLK